MTAPKLLDTAAVADMLGVGVPSVRTYMGRARANKKAGKPRPGDLPEPDLYFGGRPVWKKQTIITWLHKRPGRGAGGGRPPKSVSE